MELHRQLVAQSHFRFPFDDDPEVRASKDALEQLKKKVRARPQYLWDEHRLLFNARPGSAAVRATSAGACARRARPTEQREPRRRKRKPSPIRHHDEYDAEPDWAPRMTIARPGQAPRVLAMGSEFYENFAGAAATTSR